MSTARGRACFVGATLLVHIIVFFANGALRGEPARDEVHFWPTSVAFAESFPPGLQELRGYNELSTPLPFVVFGGLEHFTGHGLVLGRILNLTLCFFTVCIVGLSARSPWHGGLCVAGLLSFPYFLGTGVYLYTDMPAAALGVLGVWLHLRSRVWPAAACFALAIACRQYMLAIPVAIAAWELTVNKQRRTAAILPPLLGAATIGFWYLLFDGPAPPRALANQNLDGHGLLNMQPKHALYFLATLGLYYVIPELVLFRDRMWITKAARWRTAGIAGAVAALFLAFPPLGNLPPYPIETMGFMDKAVRIFAGDSLRMVVFAALAFLAAVRFARWDLSMWLVLVNAGLLMRGHIAWDKYALPCIVCLWLVRAMRGGGTGACSRTRDHVPQRGTRR